MVDLKTIKEIDPELYDSFVKEFDRQQYNLELIASENIVSPAVMAAMGTFFTNKYAEGYRIEYDQDIPKFLNKFGTKFGAKAELSATL